MTRLYMRLRACERLSINPAEWSKIPTELRQHIEDFEIVREQEEARAAQEARA